MRPYAFVVTALLSATPALTQTSPPSPAEVAPQADPKACAPGERLQLQQQGEVRPAVPGTTGQNLGEKLSRTEGVLCPPPTGDAEMTVPPPAGGRTPVIPPPGSPGGDPTVRPK